MCYNFHGYDTLEIAAKILLVVKSNMLDPLYANYVEWLIDEQGYNFSKILQMKQSALK
jgi:hypothetical protein